SFYWAVTALSARFSANPRMTSAKMLA
ncbi:hypothetical protein A2U01_0050414, partial [Trifolium medium]|nr:hypothetical protein [Trifolium medium]